MKIVIGTSRPFHMAHLARELCELGHDVTLIGYMPKWEMKKYNIGSANYICIFWNLFPLSLIALQRTIPKLQSKVTFLLMSFVDSIISKKMPKCDVFIGLSGVVVNSFKTAKEKFNALVICDRGSAHVDSQNELISSGIGIGLPEKYIERELGGYKLSDYIMVPSLFALQTFLSKGYSKDKVLVNNYGVNLDRFEFNETKNIVKSNKSTINALFVGGWSFQKGVDVICEALEKDPYLHVSHIGTNGGEKIPSSPRFECIGHVPNTQLVNYYKNYDVLLLPSRQDGFGMVILEALACGLPVIASKNTGAPDVKENIYEKECIELMDDVSVDGLLDALNKMRYSKCLHKREILSLQEKELFTWRSYGNRYNNILIGLS